MSIEGSRTSRFPRLSTLDRMFLHQETADWPGHFGGLAVVEGEALLDGSGRLRLQEIRSRMDRRVSLVPQLRRRLLFPGPLGGGPLWVEDHRSDIRRHVHETSVEPPGDDVQLLDAAARLYGRLLDRRHPLWELWLLTGLSDGRVGVLFKLHHSVADGLAAVAMMGSLFDLRPDATDPAAERWAPQPDPGAWSLIADNLSAKTRTALRAAATLAHPARLARSGSDGLRVAREAVGHDRAPQTSLNRVVRAGRRIRFLRLDLEALKEVGQGHGAKVNDTVLGLWAGGLRELMLRRGEPTSGIELITNLPVSLRSASEARTIDNEVGFMTLPLPVWEPDVHRRLDLIVGTTRRAKSEQRPAGVAGFLAAASALPGARYLTAHQRSVNVKATNVMGPPMPVYLLGARILDILPITRLFGNVGSTLCAFSYAGQMFLVVTADAAAFPDLDVLMAGMQRDWHTLIGIPGAEPITSGVPAARIAAPERRA